MKRTVSPFDLLTSLSDSKIFPPIENPVRVPSKTFSHVSCAPFEIYDVTYTPL